MGVISVGHNRWIQNNALLVYHQQEARHAHYMVTACQDIFVEDEVVEARWGVHSQG